MKCKPKKYADGGGVAPSQIPSDIEDVLKTRENQKAYDRFRRLEQEGNQNMSLKGVMDKIKSKLAPKDVPLAPVPKEVNPADVPAGAKESVENAMQDKRNQVGYENFKRMQKAGYKKGGTVKKSGASKRGDGIAQRGKTKGRFV